MCNFWGKNSMKNKLQEPEKRLNQTAVTVLLLVKASCFYSLS